MRRADHLKRHPILLVNKLLREYGTDLELSFSRYKYRRRVREDKRRTFRVPISDIGPDWLLRQLGALAPDEELALESRVRLGGRLRHIPMIDFYGMRPQQLTAIVEVLPKFAHVEPLVYFSGRSFHAYFPILVGYSEWVKFMGSALLCNTPSRPSVVDQRWIGHRLIGGYAALRWSWNTPRYKSMPTRVPITVLEPTPTTGTRRSVRVAAA